MKNRCGVAISERNHVWPQEKSEFAMAQRFSIRK